MTISVVAIISFMLFIPSMVYNTFAIVNVVATFANTKWDETKSSIYPILMIGMVITGMTMGIGSILLFAIKLMDTDIAPLLVSSLSVLLTSYISYYHRFSKNLWIIRFLYN